MPLLINIINEQNARCYHNYAEATRVYHVHK